MTNEFYIIEISENKKYIFLSSPSIKEILRAGKYLCEYLKVPYDLNKLTVTTEIMKYTNYGTKVIIYYDKE